ncbi:LysR family transcriptional regulator [Alicycliphilus sp. B1]|nr:LysR family transcriptional regulator [Alicycliphilus sp. B1]
MHLFEFGQAAAAMFEHHLARAGQRYAAGLADEKPGAQAFLQLLDAQAGRGRGEKAMRRAARNVARIGDGDEEPDVDQAVMHQLLHLTNAGCEKARLYTSPGNGRLCASGHRAVLRTTTRRNTRKCHRFK